MANPPIDIVDETFVVTSADALARRFADRDLWRTWWPALDLDLTLDRGTEGLQWTVYGELEGTAEIWLERWRDGVIVHWFLRAGVPPGSRVNTARLRRRYATDFKGRIHRLKDELEHRREVGVSPIPHRR